LGHRLLCKPQVITLPDCHIRLCIFDITQNLSTFMNMKDINMYLGFIRLC